MPGPLVPITAIGAALVGSVGIVAAVVHDPSGHPDRWDERVTELVAFVEDERGHPYDHPVQIDFLTAEEYSERTRDEVTELTEEELAEIETAEGLLRAMGLVTGDIDLFESSNDLSDTGTLAYYDSETEVVTVRGTDLTPALAVTVVHELTHVLQDQLFDLEQLGYEDATSGELTAFRALVEGDAMRIENLYYESLSLDDQAAVDDAGEDVGEAVEGEAIPAALDAISSLPYALGDGFVGFLAADEDDAVDDAFRDPPTTEEHLLDPYTYLDGEEPVDVGRVPTPEGAEVLDSGDFGAASLYLVLASRIDIGQARAAAFGWGGDAYLNYVQDDHSCIDLRVVGDEPTDTQELLDAFTVWAAAGPAGAATVGQDGDRVTVHACDPGVDAVAVGEASPTAVFDALAVLATRTVILTGLVDQGAPESFAECYADGVLTAFTAEELLAEAQPSDFDTRLADIAAACPA